MVNFSPVDWEKCGLGHANKVSTIFHYSRANIFCVTSLISLIIGQIWDLVHTNILCNFGPDWLRNEVSITLTRLKNRKFQSFRANYSGVTKQISVIIELIWDLVPINISCKFGPDWLRNVVCIALTRKTLRDASMTDELSWHKPLWPLASGAKNAHKQKEPKNNNRGQLVMYRSPEC